MYSRLLVCKFGTLWYVCIWISNVYLPPKILRICILVKWDIRCSLAQQVWNKSYAARTSLVKVANKLQLDQLDRIIDPKKSTYYAVIRLDIDNWKSLPFPLELITGEIFNTAALLYTREEKVKKDSRKRTIA